MKRFPKLGKLQHHAGEKKKQTPAEMKSIVKMLNAAFGGAVVKRRNKG